MNTIRQSTYTITKTICSFVLIITALMLQTNCNSQENKDDENAKRRELMVKNQIKVRGVSNRKVLNAMKKVERHKFVPESLIDQAYEDHPLPIGHGQTISQPYIVAIMTEYLDLDRNDKVLEIGTGSGYQAAVLAELCDSVFTIEIVEELGVKASETFDELGYENIYAKIGDGYKGWPDKAPFDAIIVTCAPTHIPEPLKDQLAEGGKMIIPVGEDYTQKLVLLTKNKGIIKEKTTLLVRFVPMVKEDGKTY